MEDCTKAADLADFLYYSQTNVAAKRAADRQGYILASSEPTLKSKFLNQLKTFTCDGVVVSSVAPCINDGELCSGVGSCVDKACVCPSERTGQYCEDFVSSGTDSTTTTIGLASSLSLSLRISPQDSHSSTCLSSTHTAVVIPVAVVVLVILACLIAVLVLVIKRMNNKTDDWEIDFSELEMGEQLGTGGYGAVHKAMWKGTEVAVKVMVAEKVTKDMEKSFQDEVHPNLLSAWLQFRHRF
jgi:hypothetical protein